MPSISVIVPVYQAEKFLESSVGSVLAQTFSDFELILVDDGSGEAYACFFARAERDYGCRVLRHAVNQGKGRALKTAFNFCLQEFAGAAGVITADSDGQHSPECILACAEALLAHPEALILGCRCFEGEDVPARSEFGNKCTRMVMKYLTGITVSDTQTGLRGIPAFFMP